MICETKLKRLCDRYNIKYKYFESTNIIYLDSGLDEWQIRYVPQKDKPYQLLHKNKIGRSDKYHTQRWLRTMNQSIDCIAGHKKVLSTVYNSTHKTNFSL